MRDRRAVAPDPTLRAMRRPCDRLEPRGPVCRGGGDTDGVGYNPHRKYRAKPSDYVLVVVAVLAALALVAWALFG